MSAGPSRRPSGTSAERKTPDPLRTAGWKYISLGMTKKQDIDQRTCATPFDTFELGMELGSTLSGGEAVLLTGPLGAGKTLFTKGILSALGFDESDVSSPSFALVNRYEAALPVFHIDLWRIEDPGAAVSSVGLDEIFEDARAVAVIEWAERTGDYRFPNSVIRVDIVGDGDDPRTVTISRSLRGSDIGTGVGSASLD